MSSTSPTGSDPGNAAETPSRRGNITCDACESILHSSGDVKKKSDYLKTLEKLEDANTVLVADNKSLKDRVAELEAQLAAEKNPPAAQGADTPSETTPKKKDGNHFLVYRE